jgi:hypothetical protein
MMVGSVVKDIPVLYTTWNGFNPLAYLWKNVPIATVARFFQIFSAKEAEKILKNGPPIKHPTVEKQFLRHPIPVVYEMPEYTHSKRKSKITLNFPSFLNKDIYVSPHFLTKIYTFPLIS